MAGIEDWLGGYTLEELLGAAPVSKSKKQLKEEKKQLKKASGKRGIVSATLGAPFRLLGALIKLPLTLVNKLVGGIVGLAKLPFRLVGSILRPRRKQTSR